MTANLPSLEDLVHAICEGTPVDWDAIAELGSDTFRSQIAALRVVAGIAEVHRGQSAGMPEAVIAAVPPRRWGHLEVLESVASGAFGDVYRAWDPQLDCEVALKLLRRAPDADAHADEVVEEGRTLARLRHPHIVSVYGAARIDGQVGLWMEYLRGRTLAETVAEDGALPPRRVAEIGAALCDALAAVHTAGFVHRDVKAQNVMLADDGRVVLMDFGAGRDVRHVGLDIAGTPLYLAPEVARGAPASPQSDIFSLGVLLRYAATGAYSRDVPPAAKDRPLRRLLAVADAASARDPRQRHASAGVCAGALRGVGPSRRPVAMIAAGGSLLFVLGAILLALARTSSMHDVQERAFEIAWRTASPRRAPIPRQQMDSMAFDPLGPMTQEGLLVARTYNSNGSVSWKTVELGSDHPVTWQTYQPESGHIEVFVPSPDGRQAVHSWIDASSRVASIRAGGSQGAQRTIFTQTDLRGVWLGEWRDGTVPALLAFESRAHELALVDVHAGTVRVVRQVHRDPQGFSLSPDRRHLAYDAPQHGGVGALREIVVVHVGTGKLQKIASPERHWVMPRWSPDGARLFFLERQGPETALLVARIDDVRGPSPPVRLRDRMGVVDSFGFINATSLGYWLSPLAHFFAVSAEPDGTFNAANAVRLSNTGGTMPAWSSDGRLAWTDVGWGTGTIRIQRADGQMDRTVTGHLDGAIFPSWSPDGRRLAFWTVDKLTRALQVVDLDSGRSQTLFRRGYALYGGEFGLAWSGDGRELLISPSLERILAVNAVSGAVRTFYEPADARVEDYLHRSPDGHSLAFVETSPRGRRLRVVPLDPRGLSVDRPVVNECLPMGWHADGRSLLGMCMATEPGSSHREAWLLPIDGSARRPLGLKAPGFYFALSPDGRRIAYGSGGGDTELWLLSPSPDDDR